MKKYTIGLITGALLAVSAMMFMGAQYTTYDIDDVYRKVKNIENNYNIYPFEPPSYISLKET